jgi:hypothetical protein
MRRYVGLVILCVLLAGVILNNVRFQHQDRGWLLNVYESPLDVHGFAADQWAKFQREFLNCPALQSHGEQTLSSVVQAIQNYSPPDSASVQLLWLGVLQSWAVAEVWFDTLSPAVIVLKRQDNQWQIADTGIWSGTTYPWRASPFIRQFLSSRNPDVPSRLLYCWQAKGGF